VSPDDPYSLYSCVYRLFLLSATLLIAHQGLHPSGIGPLMRADRSGRGPRYRARGRCCKRMSLRCLYNRLTRASAVRSCFSVPAAHLCGHGLDGTITRSTSESAIDTDITFSVTLQLSKSYRCRLRWVDIDVAPGYSLLRSPRPLRAHRFPNSEYPSGQLTLRRAGSSEPAKQGRLQGVQSHIDIAGVRSIASFSKASSAAQMFSCGETRLVDGALGIRSVTAGRARLEIRTRFTALEAIASADESTKAKRLASDPIVQTI
jgi:hypothetical protein